MATTPWDKPLTRGSDFLLIIPTETRRCIPYLGDRGLAEISGSFLHYLIYLIYSRRENEKKLLSSIFGIKWVRYLCFLMYQIILVHVDLCTPHI